MDSPQKFSNSKEVIAFLAETFPACFSVEGQAKPLKIGIFQDLAERLQNDDRISKTLLRSSLRHYTSSWRYLHAIVEGASRVDLDGNAGEVIEKQHAEHAQQQLAQSKQKVVQKKREQAAKSAPPKAGFRKAAKPETKAGADGTKGAQAKQSRKSPPQKLADADLVSGTQVTVKIGKLPVPGTITEVAKEGVHVQLNSGMVVKVSAESLRLARPKR